MSKLNYFAALTIESPTQNPKSIQKIKKKKIQNEEIEENDKPTEPLDRKELAKRTSPSDFWAQHPHKFSWENKSHSKLYSCRGLNRELSHAHLSSISCLRCGKQNDLGPPGSMPNRFDVEICSVCGLCKQCAPQSSSNVDNFKEHPFLPLPHEIQVVMYHYDCPDGTAAAYSAWKFFKTAKRRPSFYGARRGDRPPNWINGKVVALFDFCYDAEMTKSIIGACSGLIIMDHHKSAMEDLKGLSPNIYFDMSRSGARLAWDFFHPNKQAPTFLSFIEDKDLWHWKIPNSRAFGAYLDTIQYDYETLDKFYDEKELASAIDKGKAILGFIDFSIAKAVKKATQKKWLGFNILVLNCTLLLNEIGNELAIQPGCDFALVYTYEHRQDAFIISLRGTGQVDLSALAKAFGGGGHPNASAFRWQGQSIHHLLALDSPQPSLPVFAKDTS